MKEFCFVIFLLFCSVLSQNDTKVAETKVLSRRKRFLIFPEGSSLQMVFCNQYPSITTIGDIFLWGITAALAYELPQDPYSPFHHKADPLHRRQDATMIYYTNEDGKIIYKRPYTKSKKLIVNPAFVKRSADINETETKHKIQIDRKQMHASQNKRELFSGSGRTAEFHRSSRQALYEKIEIMLNGLGADGRQCLLKTLCVVNKARGSPQGAFLQEILRATFTLPQDTLQGDLEYDAAILAEGSCDEMYPDCEAPLSEPILITT